MRVEVLMGGRHYCIISDMGVPVGVVLGTRPEIIKLAGILDALRGEVIVVHTGQHYDPTLSSVFLAGLSLPAPAVQLDLGGRSRAEQIGHGVVGIAAALQRHDVGPVVVLGSSTSALAGALAAKAVGLPLVHVQAGLRTHDRTAPGEQAIVVIDHLADLLAAPTETSRANLLAEGVAADRVVVTGSTAVEAVQRQLPTPPQRHAERERRGLPELYVVATIHRAENTDDPQRLRTILEQLTALPVPVVLPLHPRTVHAAAAAGLRHLVEDLHVVEPMGGPLFLGLAADAALLVSDSGGVQEEVTILGRPLLVVRRTTDRPEASKWARLVDPEQIGTAAREILADLPGIHARLAATLSPYGDGTASQQVVAELRRRFLD